MKWHHRSPTSLLLAAAAKSLQPCPTLCDPTRLPRPWDSPGSNTGVGCHFLLLPPAHSHLIWNLHIPHYHQETHSNYAFAWILLPRLHLWTLTHLLVLQSVVPSNLRQDYGPVLHTLVIIFPPKKSPTYWHNLDTEYGQNQKSLVLEDSKSLTFHDLLCPATAREPETSLILSLKTHRAMTQITGGFIKVVLVLCFKITNIIKP